MDIDDILQKDEFKSLDLYLTEQMKTYAGDALIAEMSEVWCLESVARRWFYSSLVALGGKRPYDLCKEGNQKAVEDLVGRIKYGVFS